MLVFPQLLTGANAQYPLARTDVFRTALLSLADGREMKFGETAGAPTRWELRLDQLTDDEFAAIESLYAAAEGRLRTFTLLDPMSNLFAWSEDFEKAEWLRDPLLTVAGGIEDPFGGQSAFRLTNAGQAAQTLQQNIAGPGTFQYCCSAWAKSAGGSAVTTLVGGEGRTHPLSAGASWVRVASKASTPGGTADSFHAGFSLAPGASVDIFGPQMEAQPAPGAYWRTLDRSGVYTKVRFAADALDRTATARGANAGVMVLVSVE